jgi:hypothetical protein
MQRHPRKRLNPSIRIRSIPTWWMAVEDSEWEARLNPSIRIRSIPTQTKIKELSSVVAAASQSLNTDQVNSNFNPGLRSRRS